METAYLILTTWVCLAITGLGIMAVYRIMPKIKYIDRQVEVVKTLKVVEYKDKEVVKYQNREVVKEVVKYENKYRGFIYFGGARIEKLTVDEVALFEEDEFVTALNELDFFHQTDERYSNTRRFDRRYPEEIIMQQNCERLARELYTCKYNVEKSALSAAKNELESSYKRELEQKYTELQNKIVIAENELKTALGKLELTKRVQAATDNSLLNRLTIESESFHFQAPLY